MDCCVKTINDVAMYYNSFLNCLVNNLRVEILTNQQHCVSVN